MSPKTRGRGSWVSVGIPKEIADRIDQVVASEKWGFRSRNGYVLEAIKTDLKVRGYYP